ncbi:hypothetical protein QYE76_016917 [Lolium multiflorum]|uniref:Uncharacterized protein n=1 Tax=Lolium multiflorum TaxID=4521 RepID=A0AAD8QC47_LOLMU|nr:hypothetical protein QYE76_016917 [Lolium multiflorum]
MEFYLPHGWHMSTTGYAMPPSPPDGLELRSTIEERGAQMMLAQRRRSEWEPTSPEWRCVFQEERDIQVARSAGPDAGGSTALAARPGGTATTSTGHSGVRLPLADLRH